MTAIFYDMMHQELKDYVDDILVKSKGKKIMSRCLERYSKDVDFSC